MALSLVTAPVVEPITLSEAKQQCRVSLDVPDEDALIDTLIRASRQYVETFTRRALITQTWDWKLDAFPCDALEFPMANVSAVTSVSYVDLAGDSQTWSSALYQTDLPVGPKAPRARLMPAYQQFYPSTRDQMNAVTVRFVAGYGTGGSAVPESILAGMKMLIAHWYMARENVAVGVGIGAVQVPQTVDLLLWPYRAY